MKIISFIVVIILLGIFSISDSLSEDVLSNIKNAIVLNIASKYGNEGTVTASELKEFIGDVLSNEIEDEHTNNEACYERLIQDCQSGENLTACKEAIAEKCKGDPSLWDIYTESDDIVSLENVFPALAFHLQNSTEPHKQEKVHKKSSIGTVWGCGIGFSVLLGLISMEGSCMFPCMKRNWFQKILMYCVGLGVGTMACAGTLVLIPEALGLTGADSPCPNYHIKMTTCLGGFYIFYICTRFKKSWVTAKKVKTRRQNSVQERTISATNNMEIQATELEEQSKGLFNMHDDQSTEEMVTHLTRSQSAEPGKPAKRQVATVAWIVLFGDAFHKFIDGISVGAAFTESLYAGFSVALAVVCEELPHEMGDIALLLNAGMSAPKALLYNELVVIPSFVGVVMGILLGENTDASTWILAIAGGIFIYISFVDMLPEMTEQATKAIEEGTASPEVILILQNLGLFSGFAAIFFLAHFGGEIEKFFD